MSAIIIVTDEALVKAHVKGHTRKDGSYVKDYDTKVQKKAKLPLLTMPKKSNWPDYSKVSGKPKANEKVVAKPAIEYDDDGYEIKPKAKQGSLFGGSGGGKGYSSSLFGFGKYDKFEPFIKPEPKAWHPKLNDKGKEVGILEPHESSAGNLTNPDEIATVLPGDKIVDSINGVPFAPWTPPETIEEWAAVEGQADFDEPEIEAKLGKKPASGLIILEPDGRVWVVSPTNKFGNYENTFPKGKEEPGLSLQANAIKEAYEEAGIKADIISHLGDVERTTSVTRYYLAKRTGGSPADVGWESQAVHLVPIHKLYDFLDAKVDHEVVDILAG